MSANKFKMNRGTSIEVEGAHLISNIVMFTSVEFSIAATVPTTVMRSISCIMILFHFSSMMDTIYMHG